MMIDDTALKCGQTLKKKMNKQSTDSCTELHSTVRKCCYI